jgi:5-methylcytosine-specific restriction enzyme A
MSPTRPRRPCGHPLCPAHAVPGASRCAAHIRDRWAGRGNSQARGYGAAWRKIRARVLERDGHTCRRCGQVANQVDHVVPKHKGGSDDEANLVSLCRRCHDKKTGREGRLAAQ